MICFVRTAIIPLLLALPASASLSQQARMPAAGEGVICAWAIYGVMAEVAERCPVGANEDFKLEIRRSVHRLDAYVLANSNLTTEQVAKFKSEQSRVGTPTVELCQGAPLELYEGVRSVGIEEIRSSVDALTARPGEPTWGTCL